MWNFLKSRKPIVVQKQTIVNEYIDLKQNEYYKVFNNGVFKYDVGCDISMNLMIIINDISIDFIDLNTNDIFESISFNEFTNIINERYNGRYNDFKLIINNYQINKTRCSFEYCGKHYNNVLITANRLSVKLSCDENIDNFIDRNIMIDKYVNIISGCDSEFKNFKILNLDIMDLYDQYHGKLCSYTEENQIYNRKILLRENYVMFESYGLHNIGGCGLRYDQFAKVLKGESKIYKNFKLTKETTKNKTMVNLGLYDNKFCSFYYMGRLYENILIKINIDGIMFIYDDGHKFTTIKFDIFTKLINDDNPVGYSDFKVMNKYSLKTELKTVRDYYNKYNAKLCCFNNGNGTKKYRINVSLYNDSVYLNSNLNEIKYDESLCRKIDIHTFDYLLKNGKLLNKVITDFRLLESEKKKITMKEISEMFNIPVNDMEIIK